MSLARFASRTRTLVCFKRVDKNLCTCNQPSLTMPLCFLPLQEQPAVQLHFNYITPVPPPQGTVVTTSQTFPIVGIGSSMTVGHSEEVVGGINLLPPQHNSHQSVCKTVCGCRLINGVNCGFLFQRPWQDVCVCVCD